MLGGFDGRRDAAATGFCHALIELF
jgi:hypothetical protein